MLLDRDDIAGLQSFLMHVAKRYVVAAGLPLAEASELLAAAAALDYVLLQASAAVPYEPAVAETIASSTLRAAGAALDFTVRMLRAPARDFADFVQHYASAGGLFDILRSLRERGVVTSDEIAFRAVTLANDISARRARGSSSGAH